MGSRDYLYPVSVTYLCGHNATRMEGGTKSSRQTLAFLLSKKDCRECSNAKGGREVIQVDGLDFVLPAICAGSPAQIAWAVKIRRKILNAMLTDRQHTANPVELMKYALSAKWWIDHRTSIVGDLFPGSSKTAQA